ncbi:unnamed protein product [Nyctereutes procyonoides]|uniref:(raccoon dog) hypothetical protein n=1 Tax=Nyctereutes procyonoides TaxID=34880 RepID=A0A811YW65_NYCPR|nr:unnamed protein product [Nyctereutes procyonoides]
MVAGHSQLGPDIPLRLQKGKRPPTAGLALRVPSPEEEDPRVKCRYCGVFGHKASSIRCPIKHWGALLRPVAFGSKRVKENVEPGSQRDPKHLGGLLNQAEREKAGRRRQEAEQRRALLHRFPRRPREGQKRAWKEDTESCDYVRGVVEALGRLLVSFFLSFLSLHFALVPRPNSCSPVCSLFPQSPHMPMPIYTTRRPSIPEPALLMQPRTETPDMRLQSHSTSPLSSPKVSLRPPGGPPVAQEVPIADTPQLARQPCVRAHSLLVQQRAKRPCRVYLEGPQAGSKGHGLGHTQAPPKYTEENTRPNVSKALADNSQMPLQTPGKKCAQMALDTHLRDHSGAPVGISGSLCPPGSRRARGCTARPPQPRKTLALQPSKGPQPTPATPHLGTLQPCTEPPRPPSPWAPTQPLRMVFTRLDRSCWSSGFLAAPSFLPPEKPGPAQGPPAPHMSDRACVLGPWGVLHGDLQVSSSSEDTESK